MVPWPIALLTLFYGILAAASGATLVRSVSGVLSPSMLWPAGWLALSLGVACGLPLLRPWARRLAIAGSLVMIASLLSLAALCIRARHPGVGALLALSTSVHLVVIRYLRRPIVRRYFEAGCVIDEHSAVSNQ